MAGVKIAVLGATGAVGIEMLKVLEERNFPVSELRLFGSRSGRSMKWSGKEYAVEAASPDIFNNNCPDIVLSAVDGDISRSLSPVAVKCGAVVIDNSSAFRMDENVPLVIPEINSGDIAAHKGIIANPNCSTIIALMALAPLHREFGIKRIIASTYQAVSGAGAAGITELEEQARSFASGDSMRVSVFPYQIAFNLIPRIDSFNSENFYTKEELKMRDESRKILHTPDLMVSCTCVRVPVLRSHSEALTIETERPVSPEAAREILSRAPGVRVVDDPLNERYPMPLETSGQDLVYVGRIRKDLSSNGNGLALWACGDQVRKGAATNAVQIAEELI
ncbi:MAG: aspartate-semialdehyde dehydrogenase [Synergistaceae bacterium]|nr:aspartate-semialdehyde dehydrogenase [Synergistaceae bacterium]